MPTLYKTHARDEFRIKYWMTYDDLIIFEPAFTINEKRIILNACKETRERIVIKILEKQ